MSVAEYSVDDPQFVKSSAKRQECPKADRPEYAFIGRSNVGKSFGGWKLLVVWPYGERSRKLFDAHNYRLFIPPLHEGEADALSHADRSKSC